MAFYSTQRVTSDGTLVLLPVSIEYFDRSEITVFFDDVLAVEGTDWNWVGSTDHTIEFPTEVPLDTEVMVVRTTDITAVRHVFTDGAAFLDETMDENYRQMLHIAQEARERASIAEMFNDLNMHGYNIFNLGLAVNPTDAVSLAQYQADALGAHTAKNQAIAAKDAAQAAQAAAELAQDYAETAANSTQVVTVSNNIASVNTVAGDIANVNTVATDIAAVVTVANDLNEPVSEIETVAVSIANVNTVGTNIASVNTVAGISANVTKVANVDDEVVVVAGIDTEVAAVAAIAADVSTVAGISADVQTVADNVADITNFADVYLGPKTADPTLRNDGSALQSGDLYFNTVANNMRVYSSGAWVAFVAAAIQIIQNSFTGNGSTGAYTLSATPASKYNVVVEVGGVIQTTDAYSVSGNTLTFVAAPANGLAIETRIIATNNNLNSAAASAVTFNQAGSGAVTRSVESKLREFVSAKDFGAALDGVTDDSAAIQLALNAANGTGKRVVINGASCIIGSGLSLNNHSHYDIEWGECQVSFTGGAGSYLMDMTQAGRIRSIGGVFIGNGSNHFVKTRGSASAQATAYPTIPSETLWARQLTLDPTVVNGFATAFDLQNFTREVWISGYVTGNATGLKITGKVVNVFGAKGMTLYSNTASSQALLIRGDSGDATYRYAEGIFLAETILDTVGTTADVRDVYLLDLSGTQIKAGPGGIALDITKGVCPITRNIFVNRSLIQGKMRIGYGLASSFLFDVHGAGLAFSDVAGTAMDIQANTKGVSITDASFNNGTSSARMFAVGDGCTNIVFSGLNPDALTYTNAPTISSASSNGVRWSDKNIAFAVQQNATQTLSATTWTKIQLQNKVIDTDTLFDNSTNYRFQPTVAGFYQVNALLQVNSTSLQVAVDIYKNSATTGYAIGSGSAGALYATVGVSRVIFMNGSTDYIEMYGFVTAGPTPTIGGAQTQLNGTLVRGL